MFILCPTHEFEKFVANSKPHEFMNGEGDWYVPETRKMLS